MYDGGGQPYLSREGRRGREASMVITRAGAGPPRGRSSVIVALLYVITRILITRDRLSPGTTITRERAGDKVW